MESVEPDALYSEVISHKKVEIAVDVEFLTELADKLFPPRSALWLEIFDLISCSGPLRALREVATLGADLLEPAFNTLGSRCLDVYAQVLIDMPVVNFTEAAALLAGAVGR